MHNAFEQLDTRLSKFFAGPKCPTVLNSVSFPHSKPVTYKRARATLAFPTKEEKKRFVSHSFAGAREGLRQGEGPRTASQHTGAIDAGVLRVGETLVSGQRGTMESVLESPRRTCARVRWNSPKSQSV